MPAWNLPRLNQWVSQSSLQGLEDSYQAAQMIKSIEDEHFQGERIVFGPGQGKTVSEYFGGQRDQQLLRVRIGLARFHWLGWLNLAKAPQPTPNVIETESSPTTVLPHATDEATILLKLAFIESVVDRYRGDDLDYIPDRDRSSDPALSTESPQQSNAGAGAIASPPSNSNPNSNPAPASGNANKNLPFFLEGLGQFSKELKPEYEQEVVQQLRLRRKQNKIAVRWLVLLLLLPILVQVMARNLVFEPLLNAYGKAHYREIDISTAVAEDFVTHFTRQKETLEIQELLGLIPEMTPAEKKTKIKDYAKEKAKEALFETLNGIKNMLADATSLGFFALMVFIGREKLNTLKHFSHRAFLSLSDPAKVFLFILITDMFVGFHSPEGWEVILAGISEHFGLPPSHTLINLFIATVPVILDTTIKFWIFNYLTRFSPSTSAIYERMDR
jgi:CemA family